MNDSIPRDRWHIVDPDQQMFHWITGLPDQIRNVLTCWPETESMRGPIAGVLIAGMGGSAMAARTAALAFSPHVPTLIVSDERVPEWLDEKWLFVACSYSGNTRETLACLQEAMLRGCSIAAVSSGGRLKSLCQQQGYPYRELTPGQPPRTAVGQVLGGVLWILWTFGLIRDPREDLSEAASVAESVISSGLLSDDPWGTELGTWARRLADGFSIVIGAGISSIAALRWVQQLNENAKLQAFCLEIPEMLHNQIEALPAAKDTGAHLLLLADESQTDAQRAALDTLAESPLHTDRDVWLVRSTGKSDVARIFSLMCRGDQLSYLAALYRGVDPTPVERINEFKRILAGG